MIYTSSLFSSLVFEFHSVPFSPTVQFDGLELNRATFRLVNAEVDPFNSKGLTEPDAYSMMFAALSSRLCLLY